MRDGQGYYATAAAPAPPTLTSPETVRAEGELISRTKQRLAERAGLLRQLEVIDRELSELRRLLEG